VKTHLDDLLDGSAIARVGHRENGPVLLVNATKQERLALFFFSVILKPAWRAEGSCTCNLRLSVKRDENCNCEIPFRASSGSG
jgi:hypothetical protein